MSDALAVESPPTLWPPETFSKEEQQAVKNLSAMLHGLKFNVEAWAAALSLYQYAKARPPTVERDIARRWKFIAIHECVMQLAYLRERLDLVRARNVRTCPSVVPHIDVRALKDAVRSLDGSFPDIRQLRHAIAHTAEVDTVPSRHAPSSGFALSRITDDDRFEAPWDGITRHLDITAATLAQIENVVRTFFRGFEAAARELERLGG